MTAIIPSDGQGTSTRPYLIRALHDWCTDNGFTPYLAVYVDQSVQVPMEYVKNNEIVLNVGFEATSGLKLGNEFVEFKARFGGVAREIVVPIDHVVAIYARENGQGMAFPAPAAGAALTDQPAAGGAAVSGSGVRSAPGKGLRLASSDAGDAAMPVEPTLSGAPAMTPSSGDTAPSNPEPEPPLPPPTSGRPALKRIK
jgi:stringent starvation protein B